VVVDLDGDVVGNPPATFTVLPRALRVVLSRGRTEGNGLLLEPPARGSRVVRRRDTDVGRAS
jgi:hypothetical protein